MPVKRAFPQQEIRRRFRPAMNTGENGMRRLYVCVSTNDRQTLPMQMRTLRDYVTRRAGTKIDVVLV